MVEYLTGKRLSKRYYLLFVFKIDATGTCARNLSETDGLEFRIKAYAFISGEINIL